LTGSSAWTPPPPDAQRRMLVEWTRLARSPGYCIPTCAGESHGHPLSDLDRRNMFIAVGLMLAFGFRKSDAQRARWNWFERDEHGPLCRVRDVTQKNKQTTWEVSAVDPFWTILQRGLDRNGWRGAPDDFCLAARVKEKALHSTLNYFRGGESDRAYTVFFLVGRWLRWLRWNTQKTNHALRDFTASKLTMRYNLRATAKWCRHSSQATTEQHYSRFESRAEQTQTHKLAWLRWAN
jgi:integrase